MIRAADLPVREIVEPATVRLVTAGYLDKPAMALPADDPAEFAILEEIEGLRHRNLREHYGIPGAPGRLHESVS